MELWDEYTVTVPDERIGVTSISICGLCGNSDVVDTLTTAKHYGRPCGVRMNCICPNGRERKRRGW